jgi:transposase-like protein
VRPLVRTVPAELPRCGGPNGRARAARFPHNDLALGSALCPGIREALESLVSPRPLFLLDETYIRVRAGWYYLYRAVDKHGQTVDFLLRPDRGVAAAQAFFRKALTTSLPQWPRKITLDGFRSNHDALRLLRREDPKWKYVLVRTSQYLNNLIEQDHRAIKRRWRRDASKK